MIDTIVSRNFITTVSGIWMIVGNRGRVLLWQRWPGR